MDGFGKNVGLPYLLLDPEYQHNVDFSSMLIIGLAFGIFSVTFYMTSYILDGHKFPFLATVKYPFIKFCVNNSLLPAIFIICYVWKYIIFQKNSGFETTGNILFELLGFFLGLSIILTLVLIYFGRTNRSGVDKFAQTLDTTFRRKKINTVRVIKNIKEAKRNKFIIKSYLSGFFEVRKVNHNLVILDHKELLKIIDKHHLNALIVQAILFVLILVLGFFKDNPLFQIPAIASGLLLFSFFTMFTGAFSYWFRGWAITGIIGVFLILNFLTTHDLLKNEYKAFGLDYEKPPVPYSLDNISKLNSPEHFSKDKEETIKILNNWRAKFPKEAKPKMVFLCVSGGGQRAALWTTHTLQHVDGTLNGDLMKHTQTITGASGGLIGATYYRELYLRQKQGELTNISDSKYADNIGKDLLNPMIFSMVVNDFFFSMQSFEYAGRTYDAGRDYSFEQKLNENLGGIMNKTVMDYEDLERQGAIPMVIMSPTIINDGRKMHISPINISYMNQTDPEIKDLGFTRHKGIEFMRYFENHDGENLRLLSALRMNATFPYITPNVELPTNPRIEVMDAGLSDNFGVTDAVRFIATFKDWIEENTGGAIIVTIRDSENNPETEKNEKQSLWSQMVKPAGSLFNNWEYIQDYTNESQIEFLEEIMGDKIDHVSFQYIPEAKNWDLLEENDVDAQNFKEQTEELEASLSWHLTTIEKESIKRTIHEEVNQLELERLRTLLSE